MQKELTIATLAGKIYTLRPVPMPIMPSENPLQWLRFQGAHLPDSQLSDDAQCVIQEFMTAHKSEALTDGSITVTIAGGMLAHCHPKKVLAVVPVTKSPVTFCYRELTKTEGLWVSIPHEAPAGHKGETHMRQGVIGGHVGSPRCAVADSGFFYGLDAHGKELSRDGAAKLGLIEEEVHA